MQRADGDHHHRKWLNPAQKFGLFVQKVNGENFLVISKMNLKAHK